MNNDHPIYLDNNATTEMDRRVFEAMIPYFINKFGNPSSAEHIFGVTASSAVEEARCKVALAIGAAPEEIFFTGSCTESDNLAIIGTVRATGSPQHIITSKIEHPAVLESFRQLESEGHRVTYLPVDDCGKIRLEELEATLKRERVFLVSIMGANNEVGTLQPLSEISILCRNNGALFHSDLAQMPSYFKISVNTLGLDLASFSGHKINGPKGVGILFVRRQRPRIKLLPLSWGGGHERGLRNGTLNVPLIVGMGVAMEIAASEYEQSNSIVTQRRELLKTELSSSLTEVSFNGHSVERLPGNLSVSMTGIEPLALIRLLRNDVAFSASSACSTQTVKTSHVLMAMFGDTPRARRAFRLSPSKTTSEAEILHASKSIINGCAQLRTFSH
ncbi:MULTISPECIES: cysteine desulfurase family protein [Pseudomonas syringae group]|uniref:cysteine desulfurase n=2 Tax=Pseudomonas syringae group TaxID=136849 RepID=A0A3M4WAJ7_PSECI|nr:MULTISPECIES: cysteine desulfurase family protein [Pseudomonas]MBX8548831.1 cysteine desulfurase [Pseudomonas cichorii]MBX8587465.1 cysteine desulfurase [Pseudomonas cichorii]MDO7929193.1 cysteine desulfurase family protein [Pseudomonas sp. KFB-138]RMR61025.1 Aminotransferase, s V [Pseudomonas cichorii]